MDNLERRARGEPERGERGRDTNMRWALGLSLLALGAVMVPAGGPIYLWISLLLVIGATVTLMKGLDRYPEYRQTNLPSVDGDPRNASSPPISKERELLSALRDSGGSITPVEAAIETSLTVREADTMLSELAGSGHLALESRDGALFYFLPGRGDPESEDRD